MAKQGSLFKFETEHRLPHSGRGRSVRVLEALQRYRDAHDAKGKRRVRELALLDACMKGFDDRDYAAYYSQLSDWRKAGQYVSW